MNKKYIIISSIVVLVILLITLVINLIPSKKSIYKTITLDINPSIEINLDRKDFVISVKALNEDAKEIIDDNLKDKSFDDALKSISNKLIEKDYGRDGDIVMLINSSIDDNYEELRNKIMNSFKETEVNVEVISIDKVSVEDKKIAKEHNITPYKAAYINSIKEVNENINIEELIDKTIEEINEIEKTGNYCNPGYTLEGDRCFKEIERVPAHRGNVCPRDYSEYNGKCYLETRSIETGNLICYGDHVLKNGDCVRIDSHPADGDCADGHYISSEDMCEIPTIVGEAYEFCRDPGRTLYDGKCLATKPSINGGCLNGDMFYNGKCVNTRDDYYLSEWKCPSGEIISSDKGELLYSDKKCREWQKVKPTSYKCDDGFTLDGKTCTRTDIQAAFRETACPDGFTKTEQDRCVNLNNVKDSESGMVCDRGNSRVIGNECVIYEIVEAKKW